MVDFRIDVVVDPKGAVAGTQVVERELVKVQNRADRVRLGLGSAFGFLAGGAVLTGGIKTLAEFEQAMSEVAAVSDATGNELQALRDKALELGAATKFTAVQSATALADLARAGFSAGETLAAVGDTLQLAQAGGLGLSEATDIAASALRSFQLSANQAGRVADVFAKAANASNTSVQELGEGLKFVAPIASTVGISLEQTAAAMGVLSNSGLKATVAGTGLRQIIAALLNPSKDAAAIFQRLGLSTADYNIQTRGLVPVLQDLADKGFNVADALTVFGDRGGPAFQVLKRSLPDLVDLTKQLENAGGSARKTSAIMADNLNGSLLRVRSAFESLILAVGGQGGSAGLRGLLDAVSSGLRFLAANADSVVRFLQNLALFLGPRYLYGALRSIATLVAANPLGLLVTAISAIIAVIPDLQGKLNALLETFKEFASTVTGSFDVKSIFTGLATGVDAVIALFNGLGAAAAALFEGIGSQPAAAGELIKKGFRDAVEASLDYFLAFSQTVGNIIKGIGTDFIDLARNVGGAIGAISVGNLEAAQTFADNLTGTLQRTANRVSTFVGQFQSNLKKLSGTEILPEVEITAEASQLGQNVSDAFNQALIESTPTAEEALDRLFGRQDELAKAAAQRAAEITKDLKPAAVPTPEAPGPSQRAQELITQLDAVTKLRAEEAALNEVLKVRPDLENQINAATLAAKISALETATALEDGFTRAFLKLQQEAENLAAVSEAIVNAFADRATDAITQFVKTGEFSFKRFASAVLEDIERILIRLLVVQAISAALGGLGLGEAGIVAQAAGTAAGGGGGRAKGGTVQPDRSYIVGEHGPELFKPGQTGTIVPNGGAPAAPPPQVHVQVVNVDDPDKVPQAITSGKADEAIINALSRNRDRVSQVIR